MADGTESSWDQDLQENSAVTFSTSENDIKTKDLEVADFHVRRYKWYDIPIPENLTPSVAKLAQDQLEEDAVVISDEDPEPAQKKPRNQSRHAKAKRDEFHEAMLRSRASFFFNLRQIQKLDREANGPFKLNVRRQGTVFKLNVKGSDTVESVKGNVYVESGFPVSEQCLFIDGGRIELDNLKTLAEYLISKSTTVILTLRPQSTDENIFGGAFVPGGSSSSSGGGANLGHLFGSPGA